MNIPPPQEGLVVRYWYSWGESRGDSEAAVKDRPCVILRVKGQGEAMRVALAPITHTQPEFSSSGIKLTGKTQARLGLDARPQWIITNHINECAWPSGNLEPVRGTNPPRWSHGQLPDALGRALQKQVTRNRDLGRLVRVMRDRTPDKSKDRGDRGR